jgi:hypothetical protein
MTIELVTRDIFLRHTATDGKSYVRDHRVWDADRFIAAQQAAAQKLNDGEAAGKPRLAKVEQITEEQYRAERKAS